MPPGIPIPPLIMVTIPAIMEPIIAAPMVAAIAKTAPKMPPTIWARAESNMPNDFARPPTGSVRRALTAAMASCEPALNCASSLARCAAAADGPAAGPALAAGRGAPPPAAAPHDGQKPDPSGICLPQLPQNIQFLLEVASKWNLEKRGNALWARI